MARRAATDDASGHRAHQPHFALWNTGAASSIHW